MELREIIGQLPIGKRKEEKAVVDNIVLVMREFGYTIQEMELMPVPTFISLLDFLRRQNEAEEREMRKAKMRK